MMMKKKKMMIITQTKSNINYLIVMYISVNHSQHIFADLSKRVLLSMGMLPLLNGCCLCPLPLL
jgi:hypothetical protein